LRSRNNPESGAYQGAAGCEWTARPPYMERGDMDVADAFLAHLKCSLNRFFQRFLLVNSKNRV